MAIGRLLSPKLTPPFSSRGFVPLTRRCFSSSLEDDRKFQRSPHSDASAANKEIGQTGLHWYSLGGLFTNLKEKILGNINKSTGEDSVSVSPKSPSPHVTATKVISLQNVAENTTSTVLAVKEESDMGSQDASQCVNRIEVFGKREGTSENKERVGNNNSFDSSEFAQEKVLRLITAARFKEPNASLGISTEQASESLASLGENHGKLQNEKGRSHQKKPPQNKLSNVFMVPNSEKRPLAFEALSYSNSSMSTGEPCLDVGDQRGLFGKMPSGSLHKTKNIFKENDKNMYSDAPQNSKLLATILLSNTGYDQKSGDLAAFRERKRTFSFESSRKTAVPVAVRQDLDMKTLMGTLNCPTDNGTDTDANLCASNGGEGKCLFSGNSVEQKSDHFCAMEEDEAKQETLQVTGISKVTKRGLDALSTGDHSPNKVVLRFLQGTFEKKDVVERFSEFGAVEDVQEIPSFEGCKYKDALLTFKTKSAVNKALKKGLVMMQNYNAVVEATCQRDMVERICIPNLIGDPDVPVALVKKPTQTVKIHPITDNISSSQIKEALSFCRSDISKYILGSSRTTAFVEFKTEDDKERALAEHSISIFNKKLLISRIDIPRTTVARISNLSESAMRDIRKLCVPYGKIKQSFCRAKGIVDVCFDVSEWPNMLTILNSMNGTEIDGTKWVVRPATTVIPPEILKVLWEDPQGKRYVRGVIQNMVREIQQPLDASPIALAAMHL